MKRLLVALLLFAVLAVPVGAMDFTAPPAPDGVDELMPVETESFADGLWKVITGAIERFQPDIAGSARSCLSVMAVVMLICLLRQLPGGAEHITELAGTLAIAALLLSQAHSMVRLGADTVTQLSEYGKLLLPVMTAAMAAQGAVTSSAALYAGTAAFDALLSAVIAKVLVPMVYMYLVLGIAFGATGEELVKKLRDFMKWLMSWGLKTILYVFTGYISITGVVNGSADAAAIKATKLTISGMVPVVGGILSDASEAVIVGAGVMKSAVGVYGLLAVAAICIGPFLQLGVHYLLLKLTAAICAVFDVKNATQLIQTFSTAMGVLLGMTGAVCFLLLISTVCFMKGVS